MLRLVRFLGAGIKERGQGSGVRGQQHKSIESIVLQGLLSCIYFSVIEKL